MARKPPLSLVSDPVSSETGPPRPLGNHGLSLWNRVMLEYDIRDSGGLELLCLACEAIDRAQECRDAIARDGAVLQGRTGAKEHPLLRAEMAAMAFCARCLQRLGLNLEPVRSHGRPAGGGIGWRGP